LLQSLSPKHPIRMGTKQLTVGIDHFRLEPQAKLHTEPDNVIDQRRKAVRIDLLRGPPVAEASPVISP